MHEKRWGFVIARSRRGYLVPLLILAAAMVAAIALRALPSEPGPRRSASEAIPERIAMAGPVAEGAYRFLILADLAAEPLDALVVDFLGRRFGIEELRRSTSSAVANLVARGGNDAFYVRLVMPASDLPRPVRETELPSLEEVGPLVYYPIGALHCDRVPLQPGFLEGLAAEAGAGGYRSTHSALALLWGYEQGCIDRTSTAALYDAHLAKITEILTTEIVPGDLYAESAAMVEFMSQSPAAGELVERLGAVQTLDGSIPPAPGETSGATHSTALTLWAMLERTDPSRPPGDWIVMPGPPAVPPLKGR